MALTVWVWWDRDEPEDGLLGFHTKEDRDTFSEDRPGPFRRRVSPDGRAVSQLETWSDIVARLSEFPNGQG